MDITSTIKNGESQTVEFKLSFTVISAEVNIGRDISRLKIGDSKEGYLGGNRCKIT